MPGHPPTPNDMTALKAARAARAEKRETLAKTRAAEPTRHSTRLAKVTKPK